MGQTSLLGVVENDDLSPLVGIICESLMGFVLFPSDFSHREVCLLVIVSGKGSVLVFLYA